MMTLRAFDARMQMAQRQGKTSFYMQHMGEEGVSCAFQRALLPGDMNFPDLSPGRAAHRVGLSARRHDVPDLFQRARSAEGPAIAGALFGKGSRLLLDLRQPCDAVHPGRRLGDGLGDQERHQDRRRVDRRRLDGRIRFSRGARLRLHLQGAGRPQYRQQPMGDLDLPGHRARRVGHLRGARSRLRASGFARRRQRFSRGACGRPMGGRTRKAQSRRHGHRIRDLPRRRAFEFGRSLRLPSQDRIRCVAAGRPDHPPQEPPDLAWRVVRGAPQAGRGRSARHRDRAPRRKPSDTARFMRAAGRRRATCSRASMPRCRRICAGSASRREF